MGFSYLLLFRKAHEDLLLMVLLRVEPDRSFFTMEGSKWISMIGFRTRAAGRAIYIHNRKKNLIDLLKQRMMRKHLKSMRVVRHCEDDDPDALKLLKPSTTTTRESTGATRSTPSNTNGKFPSISAGAKGERARENFCPAAASSWSSAAERLIITSWLYTENPAAQL